MRLPVLESRGTNEYCSAQKSRKLPGLLDWVENGTNNSWLPNHLYKHHISQYHNPIGCTECCRGSNDSNMYDFCMTSLDIYVRQMPCFRKISESRATKIEFEAAGHAQAEATHSRAANHALFCADLAGKFRSCQEPLPTCSVYSCVYQYQWIIYTVYLNIFEI